MPFKYFGRVNYTPYTKVSQFADELQKGRFVGSKCRDCGEISFPPRADCQRCLGSDFEFIAVKPEGSLVTFTVVHSAPAGFEDLAPYVLGLVDLDGGGRVLSWIEGLQMNEIKIGMRVRIVPKIFEEIPEIKLYYAIEKA
ncbi:MAG: Zn-ribbon domain-containing OB-fold protein [Candidatus Thermoplasmatota archaeon]